MKAMEMGSSIHRAAELRSTHPIRPPPEPDSNRSICSTTTHDAGCALHPFLELDLDCFVGRYVRWLIVTSVITHQSLCVEDRFITSIVFSRGHHQASRVQCNANLLFNLPSPLLHTARWELLVGYYNYKPLPYLVYGCRWY
jgi:hypothetical protein